MKKNNLSLTFFLIFHLIFSTSAGSAGEVYLVIGSDTAIWEGMNVARYHCTYNPSLYTDPMRNTYSVMAPSFRADLVDSYGQPLKMTWWMMAGNIFRYATNTNIPVPNIMTLYLMKKYHGDNILANGDELTLHYHTFVWTDYDQDGQYYWNQAKTFMESRDDFNVTLAQFLLEEQVFPVSFRSGWHYMDNEWQNYLDERILPYSLHNDYPHKKTSDPEPIDNIYDWSQAPSAFVPYHPDKNNYQIPGDSPGWQVRSAHIWRARVNDYMDSVFAAAQQGKDQVACFWAHLPESDFLENLQKIDSVAHHCETKYPGVKFRYCTAIEAMQRWRKGADTTAPTLIFNDKLDGEDVYFHIESDEAIFQRQPFVAVKNIYEEYDVLECISNGEGSWQTVRPVPRNTLVKAGVTVCDTLGNQSMKFIIYLPDVAYIDNSDEGYTEEYGQWNTSASYSWGTDSRVAEIGNGDSAKASWTYSIPQSAHYNIFVQFPDISDRAEQINFRILQNDTVIDTVVFGTVLPAKQWNYISTVQAEQGSALKVEMYATGKNQTGKNLAADVLKISALVREKDIDIQEERIDFGAVSIEDTAEYALNIFNQGIQSLQVTNVRSLEGLVETDLTLSVSIPPMSAITIPLKLYVTETGTKSDSLQIFSDDPREPLITLPVTVEAKPYFHIIDNEDSNAYEEFGEWHTSVANIYGPSSRYAWLNSHPLASARFFTRLKKSGMYEIYEIVPRTVNSTDDALYEIRVNGKVEATYHVNQNEGSGNWVRIGMMYLPADTGIELWVKDSGNSTTGDVLRTDAVRFSWLENTAISQKTGGKVHSFALAQNYPNPFNPGTVIRYELPEAGNVQLTVYNALGQEVKVLVNEKQNAGEHTVTFHASSDLASGIYFYVLRAGQFEKINKMILLR
ncbi:MAG: T9SS C-terminal target domain-containing protein [Calditrichaeota bacterium]|nr:MAG: T9SS C-terminal target domain-containing protein [Calditrichota bacterium]